MFEICPCGQWIRHCVCLCLYRPQGRRRLIRALLGQLPMPGPGKAHPKPRPLHLVALPQTTPWPPMMSDNLRFLHTLAMPAAMAERLAFISALAQLPLERHVGECERVPVDLGPPEGPPERVVAYRFTLRGMQEATGMPLPMEEEPPNGQKLRIQNWPVLLAHGTSFRGLLGILREKRIRGVPVAEGGVGEHGVYFLGKVAEKHHDHLGQARDMFKEAWGHGKNASGVIFECWSEGPWTRRGNGSTEMDQASCARGVSVHLRRAKENRWCIAVPFITMRAMWLLDTSLEGLQGDALFGRWVMNRRT